MMLYNLLNSPCFIFLLSCVSLWACYQAMAETHDTFERAKRYAFCNRNDGGVIRFEACEDARRHSEVMRLAARDLHKAIFV